MALATAQRRGGESGARCINDALLGYSIGLVARVHKFVYKSHRSSSEVTARINFALAATPLSYAPGATGRRTTRAPKCARARKHERTKKTLSRTAFFTTDVDPFENDTWNVPSPLIRA